MIFVLFSFIKGHGERSKLLHYTSINIPFKRYYLSYRIPVTYPAPIIKLWMMGFKQVYIFIFTTQF